MNKLPSNVFFCGNMVKSYLIFLKGLGWGRPLLQVALSRGHPILCQTQVAGGYNLVKKNKK
jgi:hypothetical protein